jgi:hypothetical protein
MEDGMSQEDEPLSVEPGEEASVEVTEEVTASLSSLPGVVTPTGDIVAPTVVTVPAFTVKPPLPPLPPYTPKTQKARGIVWAYANISRVVADGHPLAPIHPITIFPARWYGNLPEELRRRSSPALARLNDHTSPVFARPAPRVPQHGFVESRVVASFDELAAVAKETFMADPKGEVILCDYYPAEWNGVLVAGSVTLGPGHAGATSGQEAWVLPISPEFGVANIQDCIRNHRADVARLGPVILPMPNVLFGKLGINAETEDMYYEFVGYGTKVYLTQLRPGPRVGGSLNFIPKRMLVERVEKVKTSDLMVWAKVVKEFPPGTVVYHNGGSVTSHYGVHAVMAGVPYIVRGDAPQVGSWVYPDAPVPPPQTPAFAAGVAAAEEYMAREEAFVPIEDSGWKGGKQLVSLIFFSATNAPWLMRTPEGAKLLGATSVWAARIGVALIAAEARHAGWAIPSKKGEQPVRIWNPYLKSALGELGLDVNEDTYACRSHAARREIWESALSWPRLPSPRWFQMLYELYTALHWPGGGYGGVKWGECTEAVFDLRNAIVAFSRTPQEPAMLAVIAAVNRAVHVSHNGNKLLMKLCDGPEYAACLDHNGLWLMEQVAPLLWQHQRFLQAEQTVSREALRGYGGLTLVRQLVPRVPGWARKVKKWEREAKKAAEAAAAVKATKALVVPLSVGALMAAIAVEQAKAQPPVPASPPTPVEWPSVHLKLEPVGVTADPQTLNPPSPTSPTTTPANPPEKEGTSA